MSYAEFTIPGITKEARYTLEEDLLRAFITVKTTRMRTWPPYSATFYVKGDWSDTSMKWLLQDILLRFKRLLKLKELRIIYPTVTISEHSMKV